MLTLATVAGLIICYHRAPKKGLNQDRFLDLFLWCAPAGIIGARAYYVIFEWDYYSKHLNQILNFRGGGLAIHGVLIAVVITAFLVCRHYKENMLDWMELIAPVMPLCQAIGRWGNYFNSEAHGGPTDLPWAIFADGEWVHPTFLYESIWCFLLSMFLLWLADKKGTKFKGQLISLYLILYSVERYFVEGLRTDSLWIGKFRQAQLISIAMVIGGIALYIYFSKRPQPAAENSGDTSEELPAAEGSEDETENI